MLRSSKSRTLRFNRRNSVCNSGTECHFNSNKEKGMRYSENLRMIPVILNEMLEKKHNVSIVYASIPDKVYMYKRYNGGDLGAYTVTCRIREKLDLQIVYVFLKEELKDMTQIKVCRLSKDNALRLRFDEDITDSTKKWAVDQLQNRIEGLLCTQRSPMLASPGSMTPIDRDQLLMTAPLAPTSNKCSNKGEKEVKDFSLGNLKDAVVDKVRCLDRRTVTILALIVLVLLVVGKYQTIKDILIGIKDKVTRSKNFKAMIEDGTNAINGLKKIVGIKEKANEA